MRYWLLLLIFINFSVFTTEKYVVLVNSLTQINHPTVLSLSPSDLSFDSVKKALNVYRWVLFYVCGEKIRGTNVTNLVDVTQKLSECLDSNIFRQAMEDSKLTGDLPNLSRVIVYIIE